MSIEFWLMDEGFATLLYSALLYSIHSLLDGLFSMGTPLMKWLVA
jgi:hypothetical protein